jgi:hypothetical protein
MLPEPGNIGSSLLHQALVLANPRDRRLWSVVRNARAVSHPLSRDRRKSRRQILLVSSTKYPDGLGQCISICTFGGSGDGRSTNSHTAFHSRILNRTPLLQRLGTLGLCPDCLMCRAFMV